MAREKAAAPIDSAPPVYPFIEPETPLSPLRFITRRAFRYAGKEIAKGAAVSIDDPREARRLVNTGYLMSPMEVIQ